MMKMENQSGSTCHRVRYLFRVTSGAPGGSHCPLAGSRSERQAVRATLPTQGERVVADSQKAADVGMGRLHDGLSFGAGD